MIKKTDALPFTVSHLLTAFNKAQIECTFLHTTKLPLPHLHQLSPSCTRAPGLINKISTYSECQLTSIHNCAPHKGAFFHQFHF